MAKGKKNIIKGLQNFDINQVLKVIPDTGEVINKVVENAAPIVDKALDRKHEFNKSLISLPDLKNMRLSDAVAHLERIGSVGQPILVKPDKKWLKSDIDEVLEMQPKPGHYPPETLVKLYYIDEAVKDQCNDQVEIPVIKGLTIEAATELLEKKGFEVVSALAKPHKDFADDQAGCVVSFEPKPALFTTSLKRGTTITLFYVNEVVIEKSQLLLREEKQAKANPGQIVNDGAKVIGEGFHQILGKLGQKK